MTKISDKRKTHFATIEISDLYHKMLFNIYKKKQTANYKRVSIFKLFDFFIILIKKIIYFCLRYFKQNKLILF